MKTKRSPDIDLATVMPLLINIWRRFHKEAGPADMLQTREFRRVVESVKVLHERSENGQSIIGQNYFDNREHLGAYLLYQWVLHYQEGLSLIGELPNPPKRVLDLCSGPCPFAFAALRHGATDVTACDKHLAALELGADVCGRYGMPLTIRKFDCLKASIPVDGSFDLIILGHCLEELFPATLNNWQDKQQAFIKGLLKRLTKNGHLLIVDNSYLEANRRVLQLRDALVKTGVPVQAPCIYQGDCPSLQTPNSPCYAQREWEKPYLIKEIQRAAKINLNSLKMTYIIFKSPEAAWPELPDEKLYRVISPPVDSHGGKRFYLCGKDGKKNLGSRLPSGSQDVRAFDYLKRGELIAIGKALETPHSYDLIEGSTLRVAAPCGKPLPEKEYTDELL